MEKGGEQSRRLIRRRKTKWRKIWRKQEEDNK
jgi:hypothetical protein